MITGGCLCGAVRYRTAAEPITARYCWCRDCQYVATGNAAISACFPREGFVIEGSPADYASTADSGNRMHRRFCSACGTHMFSEAEVRPHLIFVRVGTLDEAGSVRPEAVIWTKSAPQWACIDATLPHYDGQSPTPVLR